MTDARRSTAHGRAATCARRAGSTRRSRSAGRASYGLFSASVAPCAVVHGEIPGDVDVSAIRSATFTPETGARPAAHRAIYLAENGFAKLGNGEVIDEGDDAAEVGHHTANNPNNRATTDLC